MFANLTVVHVVREFSGRHSAARYTGGGTGGRAESRPFLGHISLVSGAVVASIAPAGMYVRISHSADTEVQLKPKVTTRFPISWLCWAWGRCDHSVRT